MEKIKSEKPNKDSLKIIGNLIKEARLKNNESINELATDLKISVQQFKAIEEGQEELLPEKVFVKAMIKKISEKLKLDTDFMINEFNNHSHENNIEEIILATSATVEGQTTAFYIQDSLRNINVKISKLAQGLPVGGEIENLDDGTLVSAFKNRKNLG